MADNLSAVCHLLAWVLAWSKIEIPFWLFYMCKRLFFLNFLCVGNLNFNLNLKLKHDVFLLNRAPAGDDIASGVAAGEQESVRGPGAPPQHDGKERAEELQQRRDLQRSLPDEGPAWMVMVYSVGRPLSRDIL